MDWWALSKAEQSWLKLRGWRHCDECHELYRPKRSDALTCSNRCRKRRWRRLS